MHAPTTAHPSPSPSLSDYSSSAKKPPWAASSKPRTPSCWALSMDRTCTSVGASLSARGQATRPSG
eukprot:7565404-Alexandrium_andersonii.AAC.1